MDLTKLFVGFMHGRYRPIRLKRLPSRYADLTIKASEFSFVPISRAFRHGCRQDGAIDETLPRRLARPPKTPLASVWPRRALATAVLFPNAIILFNVVDGVFVSPGQRKYLEGTYRAVRMMCSMVYRPSYHVSEVLRRE